MRILIATQHRMLLGGIETYVRELLSGLQELGHEVALCHEFAADHDGPTVDAGMPGVLCWPTGADPAGWLVQASAWRPDVVYLQGLASADLEAAFIRNFRTVYFAHDYHGTCVSGTKRFAWPDVQMCERVFGTGCLWRYLPRRCGGLHPGTMMRQYRLQKQRGALLDRYGAVLVASSHMREEYRRHGVAPERLHLVPLFPAQSVPDPVAPAERPFSDRVLMVGRLIPLKGARLLLGALPIASAKLGRRLELEVAGDGPEKAELETLARDRNIPVRFLGWTDADQRTERMRHADVLAVPSVWPEPFGLVGIEAGCVGLPAVGFAVGGIPDWLDAGVSGESAPADQVNEQGLAEALVRALSDAAHWSRLRRGAWEAAHRFSRQQHLDKLQTILHAVGNSRGGS
jgi:glycosyltransferase involved in cell wall biosynthesis